METFRAIVERRGYKDAPVSTLLLEGRPPDMVFRENEQHVSPRGIIFGSGGGRTLRWKRSVGVRSDARYRDRLLRARQHLHSRMDPEIDRERAKVVNDLLFTGKVRALALVERPDAPVAGQNATGDEFKTDGRMAVLEF